MIDGFKLTITGEELRAHLADRAAAYRDKAQCCENNLRHRDPDADAPIEVLENELEEAQKRAADFAFMREHIVELEVYLLGRDDLEFVQFVSSEFEIFVPHLPSHLNDRC